MINRIRVWRDRRLSEGHNSIFPVTSRRYVDYVGINEQAEGDKQALKIIGYSILERMMRRKHLDSRHEQHDSIEHSAIDATQGSLDINARSIYSRIRDLFKNAAERFRDDLREVRDFYTHYSSKNL